MSTHGIEGNSICKWHMTVIDKNLILEIDYKFLST